MPDAPSQDDEPSDEPALDPQQPDADGRSGDDELPPMTAEEMEQMRQEMEAMESEQFAAIEQRMGRPLRSRKKSRYAAKWRARPKPRRASKSRPSCSS
jgi:hypothetical protein